ncbi:hypothetical protein DPMN_152405 [Dreissena polymorpha]|uniref:Uncharacterized protein n=1 Tax=Dreissena polymorpha TaxID=45954 RepID=A0A9D4J8B3_DREPO|nr:hypothetical protein DPMN_152405 [Dreissena polymorpha]
MLDDGDDDDNDDDDSRQAILLQRYLNSIISRVAATVAQNIEYRFLCRVSWSQIRPRQSTGDFISAIFG